MTDVFKIAEKIIRQGELQLTTEQRRQMVEQRRTQIAAIIAKKGINPQTNTPHPPQRIINAMDQAGVNVDPFVDGELQVDRVVKEIKTIIPLKFQNVTLQVKVGAQFAGKVYSIFKSSGTITSEQWLNDGSLQVTLTILAGVQDEFFQKLSGMTHGQYESKVIKREDV
jgi:ribosome maturation protein SDO1